jgi:hypothetical protein
MGATGPSLFSDDLACDVRAEFRELVGNGATPEEATQRLISHLGKDPTAIDYNDDDPVFWLALAATQWSTGRLLPNIKQLALDIIAAGADIHRWEEDAGPKLAAKRRAVLAKLRDQLISPQPAPKKLPRIYRHRTDWEVGHAIAYRLPSGRSIIFRIILIDDNGKSRTPIADIADWSPSTNDADTLPRPALIPKLPRLRTRGFAEYLDECRTPPR